MSGQKLVVPALKRDEMLFVLHLLLFIALNGNPHTRQEIRLRWRLEIDADGRYPFDQVKVWDQLTLWFGGGADPSRVDVLKRANNGGRLQYMIAMLRATLPTAGDTFVFDDLWTRVDAAVVHLPAVYDDEKLARECINCVVTKCSQWNRDEGARDILVRLFETRVLGEERPPRWTVT